MAASEHLNVLGYTDDVIWNKVEDIDGKVLGKRGIFPFTRYRCILNRPRLIKEGDSITSTPNANFHLLVTDTEEVNDDVIFDLFKQTW